MACAQVENAVLIHTWPQCFIFTRWSNPTHQIQPLCIFWRRLPGKGERRNTSRGCGLFRSDGRESFIRRFSQSSQNHRSDLSSPHELPPFFYFTSRGGNFFLFLRSFVSLCLLPSPPALKKICWHKNQDLLRRSLFKQRISLLSCEWGGLGRAFGFGNTWGQRLADGIAEKKRKENMEFASSSLHR